MKYIVETPNLVKPKTSCCGCGICAAVCPQNAIKMQTDDEGFLYPVIIDGLCVRCNVCIQLCILKQRKTTVKEKK